MPKTIVAAMPAEKGVPRATRGGAQLVELTRPAPEVRG